MSQAELERRLSIAPDWWRGSILVFENREVFADRVQREGDKLRMFGYNTATDERVNELIGPRDVKRVVH